MQFLSYTQGERESDQAGGVEFSTRRHVLIMAVPPAEFSAACFAVLRRTNVGDFLDVPHGHLACVGAYVELQSRMTDATDDEAIVAAASDQVWNGASAAPTRPGTSRTPTRSVQHRPPA
jgi:hypothetical protein